MVMDELSAEETSKQEDRLEREIRAGSAFSPTGPIDEEALFAGRVSQVHRLIRVIYQKGQHAIIYGERGVGKTSLVTVLRELLAEAVPISVSRVNCDGSDDFRSVWVKLFREATFLETHRLAGFRAQNETVERPIAEALPENVAPDDVRRLLALISKDQASVVVLDEFDRLTDVQARTRIADTIKNVSDHAINTTILIVGVADSVEKLFENHESIQRAAVQILMPRMSPDELREIVSKALAKTDLTIQEQALGRIAALSQGLPHYTHLLGQHAAIAAVEKDDSIIRSEHVELAIARAIDESHQSVRTAYQKATMSARANIYREVLLACALANTDELDYFSASSVRAPLAEVTKTGYKVSGFNKHLEKLCLAERGAVLQRKGEARRYGYRFRDPLMQPFIILRACQEGTMPVGRLLLGGGAIAHQSAT